MISLFLIVGIGALVWLALSFVARIDSSLRLPLAAAIMLGLSGYLLVGRPGLSGAPKVAVATPGSFGDALEDPRNGMAARTGPASMWLGLSDGLIRTGNTELAAQALQQGLRAHPRDVDLWVGLGNALVAHSGGMMTPAAAMAFDRAADIQPDHPAPPFFAGLALAQGGDVEGARAIWSELLRRSPPDAPWRADLEGRLAMIPPPADAPAAAPATGPAATPAPSVPPVAPSPTR